MIHKLVSINSINSIIMKNPFTREPLNRCHVIHKLVSIHSVKFHYHKKSFHQGAIKPLPCNPLSRFFSCIIFRRFSPRMVFFTSNSWPQGILHRIYRIHSDPPETKSGQAESTQGSPAPWSRMTVVCHKLP